MPDCDEMDLLSRRSCVACLMMEPNICVRACVCVCVCDIYYKIYKNIGHIDISYVVLVCYVVVVIVAH